MRKFDHSGLLLAEYQGKLFEASVSLDCSSAIFIRRFLHSNLLKQLDNNNPSLLSLDVIEGINSIQEQFGKSSYGKNKYSASAMFWMGYLYRYISYTREMPTKLLFKLFDYKQLNEVYYTYHTQSPEWCVENLLELNNLTENIFDKNYRLKEAMTPKYATIDKPLELATSFIAENTSHYDDNKEPIVGLPPRDLPDDLLGRLRTEKGFQLPDGIYHKIQIDLTYHSSHIDGNSLTYNQTKDIYETNTINFSDDSINVDDIVATMNHFCCVDFIIDNANRTLSEHMIKQLHLLLKSGTSDSRKALFTIGKYSPLEEYVNTKMSNLISKYNSTTKKNLEDLLSFHYEFEKVHPFEDSNGQIGRLILFKECLRNKIVPFIIEDDAIANYTHGLSKWEEEKKYLIDTCQSSQDKFKKYLDNFKIKY